MSGRGGGAGGGVPRKLPYLDFQAGRDGKIAHVYFRAGGRRIPITERPIDGPEYLARYGELLAEHKRLAPAGPSAGTVSALITLYLGSHEYSSLGERTQKEYRSYLDRVRATKIGEMAATDQDKIGDALRVAIKALSDKPSVANRLLTIFGCVYTWAQKEDPRRYRDVMPIKDVRRYRKAKDGGWRPWEEDEIAAVEAVSNFHMRAALILARYTGLRRGDLLRLRWLDVQDGRIKLVTSKRGKWVSIPCLSQVSAILDELRSAGEASPFETILCAPAGKPWREDTFSHAVAATIKEAGMDGRGLVFHGLRKNAGVMLALAGCTAIEIAAVLGCDPDNAEYYVSLASKEHLADAAFAKVTALAPRRHKKDGTNAP